MLDKIQHYVTFHEYCIALFLLAILAVFVGKMWIDVTEMKEDMRLIKKRLLIQPLSEDDARRIESEYSASLMAKTKSPGGEQ